MIKAPGGDRFHCWQNPEIGAFDCYAAFFGDSFPDSEPPEAPYILRYATTSLLVIGEDD